MDQLAREQRRREMFGDYRQPITINLRERRFAVIGDEVVHFDPSLPLFDYFTALTNAVFSEEWRAEQAALPSGERHPFGEWFVDSIAHRTGSRYDDDNLSLDQPNWSMMAIARLGYDLFIVQDNTSFVASMLERLRNADQFHGARYELTVGAIMAIAGLEVRYVDPDGADGKSYELIARHREGNVDIAVEAKRRHWERSRKSPRDQKGRLQLGIKRLLSDAALKMEGRGLPGIVFVDMNLPFKLPPETDEAMQRAMLVEADKALNKYEDGTVPVNFIVMTNHPYHDPAAYATWKRPEARFVCINSPEVPIDVETYAGALGFAADRYSRLPRNWSEFLGAGPAPDDVETQRNGSSEIEH